MRQKLTILVLLTATACAPDWGRLKPVLEATDTGTIWFVTEEGDVLSGHLELPSGSGPFATVVLMHGCNGLPSRAIDGWEPLLRAWGYATLVLDSFSGRGLRDVCSDALELTPNQRIPEAYAALKILATHPRIDRARIVLMGFSHGGTAALAAATEWARRAHVTGGVTPFRAFLPFYPYCNAVIPEMAWGFAAPVRVHIGKLDDWTPAATCESLVSAARRTGADASITVYPNALHAFDSVELPVGRLPHVDNAANCTPKLASMKGPVLNIFELRRCIRKGATVGWSPEATEQARKSVRAQLTDLLR